MTPEGTTVWPNDVVFDARELEREREHSLVCFLICPFNPQAESEQVFTAVRQACAICAVNLGVPVECRRADSFSESKAIQDDIWRSTSKADFLVIDVTGCNPNVMFEYGVAAAIRRVSQVIVIKSEDDKIPHPFDVYPLRYLTYSKSIMGAQDFIAKLARSMIMATTPAPYVPPLANARVNGFKTINFRNGDRPDLVLSPGITHRRLVDDGLEFGSYYVFRHSWLLLTGSDYHNVRARIRFRFQSLWMDGLKESEYPFLSLAVRSQHVLANWGGYMVVLGTEGYIWRTEPKDDQGDYQNVSVGHLETFDWQKNEFIEMKVEIDDRRLAFRGYPVIFPCDSRYLKGGAFLVSSGFKSLIIR